MLVPPIAMVMRTTAEALLRHEVGPDQGPDVSLVAAGAQQRVDRRIAVAAKIIEHAFAADEALLDLIRRLRLAEHQGDHGAIAGRGAGDRAASERLVLQARRRRIAPDEPLDRIADPREERRRRPTRRLGPHAEHEGDRDQA
jgi:hypothetical protein